MNTTFRTMYRQLVPGIFLGFLVLFLLVLLAGFSRPLHLIQFKWQFFALAVALELLNISLRFLKRAICLRRSGVKNVGLVNSIQLFVASIPLTITPSKISESYKSIWLSRAAGIHPIRAASIYLIDNISDMLSVFVLSTAGSIAYPSLWIFFLLLFLVFVAATILLQIKPSGTGLFTARNRFQAFNRFVTLIQQTREANPDVFTIGTMTVTFTLGVLSWIAQAAALFLILIGFGLAPTFALVATSCLVLSFSMLMGLISNMPGGVGVIEFSMAALLTILLNFRPEIAVAATILFRLATFWIGLLFGILFWSVSGKPLGLNLREGRIIEG
jgi:glycosyltransferase 2 family protein